MFGVKLHHNPLIARRQAEENARADLQHEVNQAKLINQRTSWESKAFIVDERVQLKRLVKSMELAEEAQLESRREQLRAQFAIEEAQFKQEIIALQETPEQARERLVAKAKKLKAERESRRQEYCDAMRRQIWRENCDDVRLDDSRKKLQATIQLRQQQEQQSAEVRKQKQLGMFLM
jgi:hypothetical protein